MTQLLQRNTRQRTVILGELKKFRNHPTAAMVYDAVKKELPKVSLGTVYRNLDLLEKAGYIKKLEMAGTEIRYDGTLSEHYHIRCSVCGRVDDIFGVELQYPKKQSEMLEGYQLEGYNLELKGTCPQCQLQQKP